MDNKVRATDSKVSIEAQIPQALNGLDRTTSVLREVAQTLVERLEFVRRPVDDQQGAPKIADETLAPCAMRIREVDVQIQRVTMLMQDVLDSLEL